MIDRWAAPFAARLLSGPARLLDRLGVNADQVTVAGFVIGMMSVPALAAGAYGMALVLILMNRLADGLDGAMARQQGPTDRGAFLDIALDFCFYSLVPLGFALADPGRNALPAALLLAAFVGTGSSFLAFAVLAQKHGTAGSLPDKGLYYLGGLTEGTETIALFVLMCVFPAAFPEIATIFAAACAITTVTRWWWGWQAFAEPPTLPPDDTPRS